MNPTDFHILAKGARSGLPSLTAVLASYIIASPRALAGIFHATLLVLLYHRRERVIAGAREMLRKGRQA